VLFYPPDFQKDRKYPLVLIISRRAHGFFHHAVQFSFAAHGRSRVRGVPPNYRGSDNWATPTSAPSGTMPGRSGAPTSSAGIDALKKLGFIDCDKSA